MEAFLDYSPVIGFVKDAEGRFLYYNANFCQRFAVTKDEWLGKSVFDLFPHEFAAAYHADDLEVLTTGVAKVVEETSPGPEGGILYWRTHKFDIPQADGTHLLGGLLLDVSSEQQTVARLRLVHAELQEANVELVELSRTDSLTGLSNRRAFDERLVREVQSQSTAALLLVDLDDFKSLNDTYGHPYGDAVLREAALLLKVGCRANDCVARIGGEEFAVILNGAEQARALEIAERLRQAFEQHSWSKRAITASLGLTMVSGKDAKQVFSAADRTLSCQANG